MIKVYGLKDSLEPIKKELSSIISQCMTDALSFPLDKKVHRFFPMEKENFFYPKGRTDAYTIIEISLIEGRSIEARKKLIHLLFDRIESELGIASIDVEITLFESPAYNWGFRGITGDEADLNYKIDV